MAGHIFGFFLDVGLCLLCSAMAIKALRKGEVSVFYAALTMFPRDDGRPPARRTYTRIADPGSYWLCVGSAVFFAVVMGIAVFRDIAASLQSI